MNIKTKIIMLICAMTLPYIATAQTDHNNMDHSKMHGTTAQTQSDKNPPAPQLHEAGNDAFGTIQEVINQLINDPLTDWEKVNLEALRIHLLDMQDMTVNIEVISQQAIDNGMVAVVRPTTARSAKSLAKVFAAHPAQLQRETGWTMAIDLQDGQYSLTTTSTTPGDVNKIRGLGYIGLMAYGNHHQPHHWAMATGSNPHAH